MYINAVARNLNNINLFSSAAAHGSSMQRRGCALSPQTQQRHAVVPWLPPVATPTVVDQTKIRYTTLRMILVLAVC
jgi:hypothetical protein